MFPADITHVRLVFSAEEWLVIQVPILLSICSDGYLYLLDEQTGYVWEKVQFTAVGNVLHLFYG